MSAGSCLASRCDEPAFGLVTAALGRARAASSAASRRGPRLGARLRRSDRRIPFAQQPVLPPAASSSSCHEAHARSPVPRAPARFRRAWKHRRRSSYLGSRRAGNRRAMHADPRLAERRRSPRRRRSTVRRGIAAAWSALTRQDGSKLRRAERGYSAAAAAATAVRARRRPGRSWRSSVSTSGARQAQSGR